MTIDDIEHELSPGVKWDSQTGHYRTSGKWWDKIRCRVYHIEQLHPPYLHDYWNVLDFTLVVCSIAGAFSSGNLKYLRVFRALRPLRVLGKDKELQHILAALVKAIPAVAHVLIMAMSVYVVMGIMGVGLMMGRFYYCSDGTRGGKDDCVGLYTHPELDFTVPRVWGNPYSNFDDFPNALVCLYKLATLNQWSEIMYDGVSITQVA